MDEKNIVKESNRRSFAKAVTWRVLATLTTTIVVYVVTGELLISLGAGAVDAIIKFALYFGHERIWNAITWGRIRT